MNKFISKITLRMSNDFSRLCFYYDSKELPLHLNIYKYILYYYFTFLEIFDIRMLKEKLKIIFKRLW